LITRKDVHILIVDDEESIRITFEMFLKREGYGRITTASSLEEALIAINEEPFDLIISDIVLEGASGTDLLKHIRKTGVLCPVVMITGFPNIETATEAVRYGAFDYISKPVNKETLLRFVRQALKQWQLEQEKRALQQENEKYRRYLEVIFRSVSDAIITVDEKLKIGQLNKTARTWLGTENYEIVNLKDLPGDMGRACFQDAVAVIEQGHGLREHQVECYKPDGTFRMISLSAAPIKDDADEFAGVVIVARDITLDLPEDEKNKRLQFHGFIGASPVMQEVYRLIESVGKVDTTVLVTGESGTGKELAAEALHEESNRKDKRLIKVDCAAIPEDLLESELFGHRKGSFTGADRDRPGRLLQADHGTLFLDEIGDISPRMQLRLLRFLQEKTFSPVGQDSFVKVDVRVIAATNVDLKEKVQKGQFREDLYYRLKVVEILLPPLRDRQQCLPYLVNHFLKFYQKSLDKKIVSISDQAMDLLCRYRWPGNVRELRHVIERACVLCNGPALLQEHFPADLILTASTPNGTPSNGESFDETYSNAPPKKLKPERFRLIEAIEATGGNKAAAAKLLGMDRSTLYRKLKKYSL